MSQDPRHVPHRLHSALQMATGLLDLPLTGPQLEALALELMGPVRALIAEAVDQADGDSPVRYAVAPASGSVEDYEVSEYAGCTTRVALDADMDSPAGTAAFKCRRQPDCKDVAIHDAHTATVTVEPGSMDSWRWWLVQFGIDPTTVTADGAVSVATGTHSGATVRLRGIGIQVLASATRLQSYIAPAAR
ncbi:hypothetical protein ABTX35_19350 [Streptomyces sp. NPDC096080]|uniref:hypothetical protein n=1 Tax=Streptomyces sp. NPDC096080 TaxID=3156693 RepID=UPI003319233D